MMKVPTYNRQTRTTAKTGAINFSVRANPGVLAQGQRAVGAAFGEIEKAAVSWYAQEQKLKRLDELNKKEIELETVLDDLKTKQRTRDPNLILDGDPTKNEFSFGELAEQAINNIASGIQNKRVKSAFLSAARQTANTTMISVNQDARTRLVDAAAANALKKAAGLEDRMVMGNKAERAAAELNLFGGQDGAGNKVRGAYFQMADNGLITETKAFQLTRKAELNVRKRKQKADAAILEQNTTNRVIIAGDPKQPLETRKAAVDNTIDEIRKSVIEGTITEEKGAELISKAADDTVRAIGMALMTSSSDATGTALAISSEVDTNDPVLNDVLKRMDPSDKQKIFKDFFTLGSKIDKERREQEEDQDAKADELNDRIYQSIINVDPNNQEALNTALQNHKILLKRNWYDPTQRRAAEQFLGLDKKTQIGSQTRTTANAIRKLNQADADNILTLAKVDEFAGELSPTDYNAFFKRAIAESKEGRTAGKNLISSKLRYNEFKDTNNALGDASNMMFQQSMFELDDWLNTPKAQNGGQGASYQEVVKKAREINAANDAEYMKKMREALIIYLNGTSTLGIKLEFDPDDPVNSAKRWLATQNQKDVIIRGITRTVQSYEKIGVR